MTTLARPIVGYRFVETLRGDSLQLVAARELGDANRWPELVSYNNLVAPFITDDPALEAPGVLLTGSLIRLPASTPVVTTTTDAEKVFERDVALPGGMLTVENGDFAVVSGIPNLKQALQHRVDTERGELIFHPQYGSLLRRLLGQINGPALALLGAEYAKAAVQQDPRISSVTKATATVTGDRLDVSVEAEPVVGKVVQINLQV